MENSNKNKNGTTCVFGAKIVIDSFWRQWKHCGKTQEEKTKECFQIPNCQNFYKFFGFFSKAENWIMKKWNDML